MKPTRLLDPNAPVPASLPATAAPVAAPATTAAPTTTVATVSSTNAFLRVLAADGSELFVEVEDKLKTALQDIGVRQQEKTVVAKLAAQEVKHPQTTLIVLGSVSLAIIVLTLICLFHH